MVTRQPRRASSTYSWRALLRALYSHKLPSFLPSFLMAAVEVSYSRRDKYSIAPPHKYHACGFWRSAPYSRLRFSYMYSADIFPPALPVSKCGQCGSRFSARTRQQSVFERGGFMGLSIIYAFFRYQRYNKRVFRGC